MKNEETADRIAEAMSEILKAHKHDEGNRQYVKYVDFDFVEQVAKKHGFDAHYLMKIGNFINK